MGCPCVPGAVGRRGVYHAGGASGQSNGEAKCLRISADGRHLPAVRRAPAESRPDASDVQTDQPAPPAESLLAGGPGVLPLAPIGG